LLTYVKNSAINMQISLSKNHPAFSIGIIIIFLNSKKTRTYNIHTDTNTM